MIKRRHWIGLGILLLGLVQPLQAQNPLERDPGYVDLNEVERWFNTEPKIEVNIRGSLLKLVAEASRREDPDLATLLDRLKAIHVRGYNLSQSGFAAAERHANQLAQRLEGRGWETVARVRDEEERVDMLVRMTGDDIAGMVVIVLSDDDEESVFMNIVGDIDPQEIGRIGSKFDIDVLDWDHVSRYRNR